MQWIPSLGFGSGKNGSPAVSGTINSYATCTGTATQTSLTTALSASLGDVIMIHQTQGTGAGQWEINYVLADAGSTLTLLYPLTYTYGTGAQAILVPQYTGGTTSSDLTTSAWNGSVGGIIALMSNGDLTISSNLTLNGSKGGSNGAPATGGTSYGFAGGNSKTSTGSSVGGAAWCGVGTGGATAQQTGANGNGGGGATAASQSNSSGTGGGGGNATAGGNGTAGNGGVAGTGGSATGNAGLTLMTFGGGGGGSGTDGSGGTGAGGGGGAIAVIFARNLTMTGLVNAYGGDGGDSSFDRGGGGAGGSILIKCITASLGTNRLLAYGGASGSGVGLAGGAGSAGRIHIDYYASYTGTTNPTIDATQDRTLAISGGSFLTNFL